MFVSVSALSRSISLLEERLGETLFTRSCRRLLLADYCGKAHPLHGRRALTEQPLSDHEFATTEAGDRGNALANCQDEMERRAGLKITILSPHVEACAAGDLPSVLPDVEALPGMWR